MAEPLADVEDARAEFVPLCPGTGRGEALFVMPRKLMAKPSINEVEDVRRDNGEAAGRGRRQLGLSEFQSVQGQRGGGRETFLAAPTGVER